MRVTVVGLGAIGGWIAGRLAIAGHRVQALLRAESTAGLAAEHTLAEGGTVQVVSLEGTAAGGAPDPQDLLLIGTKTVDLADAAGRAARFIGPETLILPLQNGVPWWFCAGERLRSVDPHGGIAAALPLDRVLGMVVHASCRRTAPASIEVVHADRLLVGEPAGGHSSRARELVATLQRAGLPAEEIATIRQAIWYKLWGNMTINPISATTGLTADRILADPNHRREIMAAMEEARVVGAAIGCPIEESAEARLAVTARLGAFKTSMLQDVEAGRPIELAALVGAVAEIARKHDILTPVIDQIEARTRVFAQARNLL